MGEKMDIEKKKCKTPRGRVSFPHVFKPHAAEEGQEAKYSLTLLFPKNVSLKEMEVAATNAAIEAWGADKKKWPRGYKWPFRDGDTREDYEGYPGHIFVAARSKKRPGLIDGQKNAILDEEAFYPGCYAKATLIAFAYKKSGNVGIAFSLQNIQKLGDGESLSGRRSAEQDFDVEEDQSELNGAEDPNNYGPKLDDMGMPIED